MRNKCIADGRIRVVLTLLLSLAITSRLDAQVVGATLAGTITDKSGAAVSNAQISVKNTGTGVVRTVTTNEDGFYSAPNLQPGNYEVTASANGFGSESTALVLTVGAQQSLNLSLTVGSTTQTVQVTDAAPTVNLVESTLGGLNNEAQIRELPLNGRSWTDLASLQPGVYTINETYGLTTRKRYGRGFGTEFAISGNRPQQNNYRIDGVSVNDPTNGGPGSILGGNLGVEAISEFSVLTTNYSTEYGRSSGGIINAITKSGTNEFHGDMYEYLRNSDLDAANYFDIKKPPFRRNQFGASAGGPIKKEKVFIFGDYEGLRQLLNLTQNSIVPSQNARNGILTSGTVAVDPEITRFLNAFYPLPNTPTIGDTGSYIFGDPQISNENYFMTRVDEVVSTKDSFHEMYQYDNGTTSVPDEFLNKIVDQASRRQYFVADETHTFSYRLLNDARFGLIRDFIGGPEGATAINPAAADTSFGTIPGDSAATISISGLTTFSGGLSAAAPQHDPWTDWQVYDDAFYTSGVHSLKFGGNIESIHWNRLEEINPGGTWTFGDLADFLTNHPTNLVADAYPGTDRHIRQKIFGLYLQDDYRLRPNLTINLGLRYEPATVVSETNGEVASLHTLSAPTPVVGNPLYQNNTLHDFDPRIGFAWDPFRTGKTSVRGGFGFYDQLPLPFAFSNPINSSPPFFRSVNEVNLGVGAFPTEAFQLGLAEVESGSLLADRVPYVQQNPSRAYVMQYNFSIQREITSNLTFLAGYVGSHGVHGIVQANDGDIVPPISSPLGYLWPCAPFSPTTGCGGIGSGTRLNPYIGRENVTMWINSSVYNGLNIQLTKRVSHGFQLQGSFTWSKVLDTASGNNASQQFLNGIGTELFFINSGIQRAPADFDVPRVLHVNYLWNIPVRSSFSGLTAALLRGWQLGGIITAQDGSPFSVFMTGDPLGLKNTDLFEAPNRVVGPGCSSLVNPGNVKHYIKTQCFLPPAAVEYNGTEYIPFGNAGRNELWGPGLVTFDSSLTKDTYIRRVSETFDVQFRVDAFNLLNRPNFASPVENNQNYIINPVIGGIGLVPANPSIDVVNQGPITSTNTTSRQLQFALKIIW
jgi:hypothetical protein